MNIGNILRYMMPPRTTLIALLGISGLALAQQPKTPAAPAARISGTVLDGTNNKPVAGVTVSMLQGSDRRNVTTDASGQFVFPATHGTVRLITAKSGYASVRPEGHQLPTDGILVSLTPGQQMRGLTLQISPTGSISGTVYDSKSKPVQYARAQLMRYTYDEDGKQTLRAITSGRGGDTNDHGQFQISQMDPGDYYLEVDPPIFAERTLGEPFTSTKPTSVTIKSGSDNRIEDVTLPSVRGATLHIHLVNQTNQPVQNTMAKYIQWHRRNDTGTATVVPLLIMGGPERAEIPLPIGIYSITAGWMNSASSNSQPVGLGNAIVEAGPSSTDTEIVVKKGVRIAGQALLEQAKGSPRPLAGVRCDWMSDAFPTLSASSVADGSILLENVQPTTYQMQCSSPLPDTYLTALRQGDRDVLKQGFQVTAPGENAPFSVSFTQTGATVEGKVTDPKGKVAGALVVLVPDDPQRDSKELYRKANADQNGAFTIRTVVPGAYHLFAWTELDGAAYKNAEFMKKYAEQGTALKVAVGDKKSGLETKLLEP